MPGVKRKPCDIQMSWGGFHLLGAVMEAENVSLF